MGRFRKVAKWTTIGLLSGSAIGLGYDTARHESAVDAFLLNTDAAQDYLRIYEREQRERNGNILQRVTDALRAVGVVPGLSTSDFSPVQLQSYNQFPFVGSAEALVGTIEEPADNGSVYRAAGHISAQAPQGELPAGFIIIMDERGLLPDTVTAGVSCTSDPAVACEFQNQN